MNRKRIVSRFKGVSGVAVGAVSLFAASCMLMVPTAEAAEIVGEQMVNGTVSTETSTRNLAVTLKQENPFDDPGEDGKPNGSAAGITIVAERLAGIDPKDQADMDKVRATSLEEIQSLWPKSGELRATTDASGTGQFASLETGIYLVTSIAPDDGKTYQNVAPFLVSVPFFTIELESWFGVIVAKPCVCPIPPGEPSKPCPPGTTPGVPPVISVPDKPGHTPGKPVPGKSTTGKPTTGKSSSTAKKPTSQAKSGSKLPMTGVQAMSLLGAAAVAIGASLLFIQLGKKGRKSHE